MMVFDLLFGDEPKKIYRRDFNKALKSLSDISKDERKYLNQVFKNDLRDGLTKYELEKKIADLRHKSDDPLEPEEVKQVRRKLLGELDK
jgi:hypothetical protein